MDANLVLIALFGLFFIYSYLKSSKLKEELSSLQLSLREALISLNEEKASALEAQKESSLIKAVLESHKQSSLNPDNAVPKSLHMEKVIEMNGEVAELRSKLEEMTSKFEESRGKQISERVRLGMVGEQFAALHENFKYDRKETKALLQPVDFICFEQDEVVFVDVKTGDAKLSPKQRRIRDNIKAGRVKFQVFRINESGAHWED